MTRLVSPDSGRPEECVGLGGEAGRPDGSGRELAGGLVRGCCVELTALPGGFETYAWRDAGSWRDSTLLSREREATSGSPCF